MLTFKHLKLGVLGAFLLFLLVPTGALAQTLRLSVANSIDLGRWVGIGDKVGESDVCVHNSAGSGYSITASAGGSYQLSGTNGTIVYEVGFSDTLPPGTYTTLPHGSARSFSGADQSSQTCGGGYNARVRITVTEATLSSARPGNYTGTVTLTLSTSP